MSTLTKETMSMLEILPVSDQELVHEVVKKLVKAWDPDFTKLTITEAAELSEAISEMENGEFVTDADIDWN